MSEKKRISKKLIAAIAIVLVIAICIVSVGALAVCGAIVGAVVMNQPKVVAANALTGAAEDVFEREEIAPILKTLQGGSIQFHISDIRAYDEDGLDESEDLYLDGKLYMSKDALMLENLNYSVDGQSISGDAYISKDEAYVYENNILGNAYGAKYSDLADELAESIFAASSGSKYAMDEETYEVVMKALEGIDDYEKMSKDAKKLADKVTKDLWKIIFDNATVESENTDIRLSGEKTSVRLISITVDDNQLEEIITEAYEYLRDSKDIPKFIDKYEDVLRVALEGSYDADDYRSLSDVYKDEMIEAEEEIDDMRRAISGAFRRITLNIATPTMSSKLLMLDLVYDGERVFALDCGAKGIKKSDTVSLTVGDMTATYKLSENSSAGIKASLDITSDYSDDVTRYYIDIDKHSDSYVAGYEYEYESMDTVYDPYYGTSIDRFYTYYDYYEVRGSYRTSGDTTTMSIDSISNVYGKDYVDDSMAGDERNESMVEMNSEFIIDKKDKMPSPRRGYLRISDITESDIDWWGERLGGVSKEETTPEVVTEPSYDYYY